MKYSEKLITFTTLSLLPILLISTFIRVEAMCPKPADIKPCTCDNEGLQCLKLNNSGLVRVFKAPAEHKAIRSVWIFQTNLTELPANAFGDYFIRDLYLDLNQITQIEPSAFGQATKTLQKLSLTRNLLTYFPFSALRRMKRLRQLALGSNQLVKICGDLIPPSDTLEHIDLGNNSIEHIEPNAFSELHELEMINLSRNKLRKIESMALSVKSSSDLHIIMRMNQISKIAVDAFGQHYPKHIDLSNNELTYLDRLTFEPLLKSNTTIDVDGEYMHLKALSRYCAGISSNQFK